ncbi:MAG: GNAT family N-acetyltransferase [Cyanobacteria bacterium J06642_2]
MTTFKTARLHMRPIATGDRPALLGIRHAPEVLRWLPVPNRSTVESYVDTHLTEMIAHWQEYGYGVWLVQNPRSRRAIGYCGLRYLSEFEAVELLYAFAPDVWGWGLASEASRAVLKWAWHHTQLAQAIALTLPDNRASRGVMENVGMQYERNVVFHGYGCVLYAISRPADPKTKTLAATRVPHLLTADDIAAMPERATAHPLNPQAVRHRRALSDALNLQRLGLHLVRVKPGFETTQFHFHHHEEEFLYILAGRGIAEVSDRQVEVGPGDLLAFAAPSAPHAMRNPFAEDLVYLMGGERRAFDLCDYPRLRKRLIRASGDRWLVDWSDLQPFGSYPLHLPDEN